MSAILIGLDIIIAATNAAAAAAQFKSIVDTARLEGRDITIEELAGLATANRVKLEGVLEMLKAVAPV